jgi:hypothetical protein
MIDEEEMSQNLLENDEDDEEFSHPTAKRSKVKNEGDVKNKVANDEEDGLLKKFPFHGMNVLVREKFKPHGLDPRGYDHPYGSDLPSDYCVDCKCKEALCHDKRFGLYCGLRVAEMIEKGGPRNMFGDKIKKLVKEAYNEILRVEIVQQIGVLDTHNNYIPPKCMEDRSLKNIMNHFFYMKFTAVMSSRLQDGSKGKYGSGSYGFYSALKEEDEKK